MAGKKKKGMDKKHKFNETDKRLRDLGGRNPKGEKERVEKGATKSRVKKFRSFKRSEEKGVK